jgi:hypothetical protein
MKTDLFGTLNEHDHPLWAIKAKLNIALERTNAVTKLLRSPKDCFAAAVLFSGGQMPLLIVGFTDQ